MIKTNELLEPMEIININFFNGLQNYLKLKNSFLEVKQTNKNFLDFCLNKECHICISSNSVKKSLDIRLYINNNKALYEDLLLHENEIYDKLGFKMTGYNKNKVSSYFILKKEFNIKNKDSWNGIYKFIIEISENIYNIFNFYL